MVLALMIVDINVNVGVLKNQIREYHSQTQQIDDLFLTINNRAKVGKTEAVTATAMQILQSTA